MKELEIVCGILQKEGKVLIAKRAKGVDEGIWEFPGGKVETNETNEQAIVRELKEELDVDVNVIKYVCSIDDIRENLILHVHAYLCELVSGDIQLHVHTMNKWVYPNELYHYQFQKADFPILNQLNNRES